MRLTRCATGPHHRTMGPGERKGNRMRDERGAATAEYAITIMAAVGFAGVLVVILRSGEVQAMLTGLVSSALSIG